MDHPIEQHHTPDQEDSFIERIRQLYANQKTALDELTDLYNLAQDNPEEYKDQFEEFLDDLVYNSLVDDEEFMKNAKRMRSGRASKDEQLEIKDRQNSIFNTRKAIVVEAANLPTEAGLDDIQKSKMKVADLISEYEGSHDGELDVLLALGILTKDEAGREVFTYPTGLFPATTDKKWEIYLESVRNHIRKSRGVELGTLDKVEVEDADTIRRTAHNAISRDVDMILGLSELPDNRWNLERTRALVAKMRDLRFPTVETAERDRTAQDVHDAMVVTGILTSRLSDLSK